MDRAKDFVFLLISQFFLLLPLFPQYHGTSPNWTTPTRLPKANPQADASKDGTGQNLIQLSTGELIQLYTEKFGESKKIYFAKSTDDGKTWSIHQIDTPFVFTPPVSSNYSPTFCKDRFDNIHMVWITLPSRDIYYCKFDKNFTLLIDTVRITTFVLHNFIEAVYITADRKNRIHILWHDGDVKQPSTATYFSKVMYRQSPDGGQSWKEQQILSDTTIHKHAGFPRASFVGCSGDILAIPWRQEVTMATDWDVWIAVSTDGGDSWERVLVAASDSMEWDPGVVVDKYNRIHLHYHEYKRGSYLMASMEYLYSDDAGATWSPIQTLSPKGIRSQLSVFAYDYSTDVQCVCWKDERDFFINPPNSRADVMCSYTPESGRTWYGQEFVTDLDTTPVGYKSVEVGNNYTLYVTFEYADPTTGLKSIWFSKRPNAVASVLSHRSKHCDPRVFPNPTSGFVSFQLPDPSGVYYLTVYSIYGKKVYQDVVTSSTVYDLTALPAGIYYYELIGQLEQSPIGGLLILELHRRD